MSITRRRFIAAGAAVGALAAAGGSLALIEPEAPPQVDRRSVTTPGPRALGLANLELGEMVQISGMSAAGYNGIYRVVGRDPLQLWGNGGMLTIGERGRDFFDA